MRCSFSFAMSLLAVACAHQHAKPAATQSGELGAMRVVAVANAPQPEADTAAAAPTAALVQQPELTSDPKPSSDPLLSPTADASGAPVVAADPPSANEVRLRERIQAALARRKSLSFTAKNVSIGVDKADVTLEGDVRTAHEKAEVQTIVERMEGVRRVHNKLAVIDERMMPAPDAVR